LNNIEYFSIHRCIYCNISIAFCYSMNLDSLRFFISLADSLHFRKTSEQQHITVSTLTRIIQRLEKELNSQLFIRNNKDVKLSESGKLFYEFCKNTLKQYEDTLKLIHPNDSKQLSGSIKLYSTVTAAYHSLAPLIKEFRERYPNIMTYLETGEVKTGIDKLMAGELDFSVGIINDQLLKHCHCQKILDTQLIYIIPSDSKFKSLSELPMIFPEGGDLEKTIKTYLKKEPQITVHSYVKGHEAILAMVAAGLGAAILPNIVVDNSHLKNSVQIIDAVKKLPSLEVGIFSKKTAAQSPIKDAFFNFVVQKNSL